MHKVLKYNIKNYNYIHFFERGVSMHPFVYYEKKQHGTREFPAEYYYVDSHHPRYVMSAHWHTEWELIRIIQGTFTIFVDEEEIPAKAGDVILLRDSMLHSGMPTDCIYECFVFDLHGLFRTSEIIKQHLRPIYRMDLLTQVYFPASESSAVSLFTGALMESCARGASPASDKGLLELSVLGYLCNLFSYILQNKLYIPAPVESLQKSYRINQIKAVLKHIEQNYGSNITLNSLADIAGMNANYFCKVFQDVTQQTPMDYVIFYRIEQSAVLLATTSLSIVNIALECGFNDHSYFTKLFKRIKGVTPRAYRKSHIPFP